MKRVFIPTKKYIGNTMIETSVEKWEWTRRKGLRVFYKNGTEYQSAYLLKELPRGENIKEIG